MKVITTFTERMQEKQIKFERKILRDISLKAIKDKIEKSFSGYFYSKYIYATAIEDTAIDVSVEAYLLGARMSRFGYYGESIEQVKDRSYYDEKELTDSLFEYMQYWGAAANNDFEAESLYMACGEFVDYWWKEGFKKGEMRYRLRLH